MVSGGVLNFSKAYLNWKFKGLQLAITSRTIPKLIWQVKDRSIDSVNALSGFAASLYSPFPVDQIQPPVDNIDNITDC